MSERDFRPPDRTFEGRFILRIYSIQAALWTNYIQ